MALLVAFLVPSSQEAFQVALVTRGRMCEYTHVAVHVTLLVLSLATSHVVSGSCSHACGYFFTFPRGLHVAVHGSTRPLRSGLGLGRVCT